jgi:hypothetical protein
MCVAIPLAVSCAAVPGPEEQCATVNSEGLTLLSGQPREREQLIEQLQNLPSTELRTIGDSPGWTEAWFLGEGKLKLCIYKTVTDTCGNGSHAFTFTRVEGDWVADEVWEIATCLRH